MIELPREKLLRFFEGVPLGDVADDAIETIARRVPPSFA